MYNFELLEKGCYYLIQEKQDAAVSMIQVNLKTDHCMFITYHGDTESSSWKRKSDTIFDIIELLDDKNVKAWESLFVNSEDAFNTGEEE
ncbi:hypothetical protein [Parasegetibacter sp. NRK P23]|uniref:hypothetical protein n=1 Tax=Parasegetibacter sp. NRK P23 TaxID=2942999 RepID=UPI00204481FD|nr:hypothetical protein [Parasegetibacter sp. NRK P23]MCM5528444.1 hypothetical protein [Parasegetibacter sp. NRK P23]